MRILFWFFTLALRAAEVWERLTAWWSRIDEPEPPTPRPIFWGWCLDCRPETVGMPGLLTAQYRCERCGSASVINVRAGGDETVRA